MLDVNTLFSTKVTGGEGKLTRIAPLPMGEYDDTPTLLIVITLTETLEPQTKLNGAELST